MGKTFKMTVNAKTHDIEVGDLSENPVRVLVNGELFHVHVEEVVIAPPIAAPPSPAMTTGPAADAAPRSVEPARATKASQATDTRVVTAPMPGVVLAVKVKPGDRVKIGEEVCTLESMKMELNIMASREGVVSKVCVAVGQSVVHGMVLVELG
jgi:biotin carboxyl carrier protein